MGKADWTRQALSDLSGWLDARNPLASRRLAREVVRSVALLVEQPEMGFRSDRLGIRILLLRQYRYRVVYQPTSGGVTILRFFHPRQSGS